MAAFGAQLPTKEQCEELIKCQWSTTDSSLVVTGPNGQSITLPAEGWRDCGGNVGDVGSSGFYWSSTHYDSSHAWCLRFYSGAHDMGYDYRCYGQSVRLVQSE